MVNIKNVVFLAFGNLDLHIGTWSKWVLEKRRVNAMAMFHSSRSMSHPFVVCT